jgi:hypothetical protein
MATGPVNFNELPAPLRVGVILAGGGGLAAALGAVVANGSPLLWVGGAIILGIMVVGSLLVVYARLLKWYKARQAKPMESQVLGSTGASPQGISDPQQLAKIDDLRRKFEEGIATFRTAGKTLYSLPWYVLLGEPGSGKTEAIRHCGIGFPPGLQDRYQGVGGTINMNWWFTDHGVILDTAGRLMFEEASTGGTREWKEFLGLLKKSRPSCPINGALLVIPSDSLICDDAEKIERKASQIAQQFDAIQRTLDVRFPVYVVITKSDLINGFREFFASISDPQLQHQILGWSNSGDMDKPYDPSFVDKYLEEMKTRLFRTRLARLGELLGEESEEQDRPMAEALYAFPHAFEQLGPRLKRYLDLIFSVGSQWSCKPLFFRGIYFTSSMQEGAALDQDLAQALGVPVESLPEGPVWKRDRAHFLRDLFLSKVFPERGLVTRATNVRKQYARRQAAILGSAAVGLLVLLVLTIYGSFRFRGSVQALQDSLEVAANRKNLLELVHVPRDSEEIIYNGDTPLPLRDGTPLYAYFAKLADHAQAWKQNKGIPAVFRPAVWWTQKISPDLVEQAARQTYVKHALQSLLQAVAGRMADQNDGIWTSAGNETQVLHPLIALRAAGSFDVASAFLPLMKYLDPVGPNGAKLIDPSDPNGAQYYSQRKSMLVRPALDFGPKYAFDSVLLDNVDRAVENGVTRFNEYWSGSDRTQARLTEIRQAVKDVNAFEIAETELIGMAKSPNTETTELWLEKGFPVMEKAWGRIASARNALRCDSLLSQWKIVAGKRSEDVRSSYDRLLTAFGAPADANQLDPQVRTQKERLRQGREQCRLILEDPAWLRCLGAIDSRFWTGDSYDVRFSLYKTAVDCRKTLRESQKSITIPRLPKIVQEGKSLMEQARANINGQRLKLAAQSYHAGDANLAAVALWRQGEQEFYQRIVDWGLSNMPREEAKVAGAIQKMDSAAQKKPRQLYDPDLTQCVYAAWKCVQDAADRLNQDRKKLKDELVLMNSAYQKYADAYVSYWQGEGGMERLKEALPRARNWETWCRELDRISQRPEEKFHELSTIGDELDRDQMSVEGYANQKPIDEFRKAWAPLKEDVKETRYRRDRYRSVLRNWAALGGQGPQGARRTLLACPPRTLLEDYFVSTPRPTEASPDHFWYELALTSLDLLATEIRSLVNADVVGRCRSKFPLDKVGIDDLTRDEVKSIYEWSKLAESSSVGAPGADVRTGDAEIDKQLKRLRGADTLPDWVRKIDVLPPSPDGRYVCQVVGIRTEPASIVRKVFLRKGKECVVYRNWAGNTWTADEAATHLGYGCTDEAVTLEFHDHAEDTSVPCAAPLTFRGPWPWHRMMVEKNVEPKDQVYAVKCDVDTRDKDKGSTGRVAVTITLRFSKKPGTEPIEIFPPMDQ